MDKLIIFMLRHHELKYGIVYLILSTKIVLKHRKDAVFIIGGDDSLKNYHMILTEKLNIKDPVIFSGRLPQSEVPFYYKTGDIVATPLLQEA